MTPFLSLLGGGVGDTVRAIGETVGEFVTTDKERAAGALALYEAETTRMVVEQQSQARQAHINKREAQHSSVFVAGWRPSVGWICATGLAYQALAYPLLVWVMAVWAPAVTVPPPVDIGPLMVLLTGMLGIGGLRTWEKYHGVARERIKG